MCRMLGIKNFDFGKHQQILVDFIELSRIGKVPEGNPPGHNDGWGIGYYKNNKATVIKSGNPIIKDKNKILKILKSIKRTKILIVHMRKSSWKKTNTANNSHPFKYKNIILGHNGTIWDYKKLIKNPNGLDSKVYLQFIMTNYTGDITNAFNKSVSYLRKNSDYTSLTCLFSDGTKLYAYREYTKSPWYYTLYKTQVNNSAIFCSEPLSDLKWKLLKKDSLLSV